MKLYNTFSRKIEPINLQHPPVATVYTCGPTVYDFPHIGNWFTFIRYDLLVRVLQLSGYKPTWVMNITDVGHLVSDADEGEDKLEKGARREGKTAWDVAAYYTEYFLDGLKRLNFTTPNYLPRATEHIQEQIDLVQRLETRGLTYTINDGVYFDTAKFPKYASFARLDLDEQQAGARVEYDPEKRNPSDFALWKFSPKDHTRDMEWDSPWGRGFPGWHLECSAMSMQYLGETLDIHSGGIDHIPVHHTNEIAQSEGATGKPFALYWMHTNHIMIGDEKISKSLNNFLTLEDIEGKNICLEAFRLHVLESHYRSQSKFSWESLRAAENRLRAYKQFADLQWQVTGDDAAESPQLDQAQTDMLRALQDDLDTPRVLAVLSEIESRWQELLEAGKPAFRHFLEFVDAALGLTLLSQSDITAEQTKLLTAREAARKAQSWQEADRLRNELEAQHIGLRDTPSGAVWYRLA